MIIFHCDHCHRDLEEGDEVYQVATQHHVSQCPYYRYEHHHYCITHALAAVAALLEGKYDVLEIRRNQSYPVSA